MSKAEYTLLAAVIAFYTLLFAYLITRALTGMIRAYWPNRPQLKSVSRHRLAAHNRAWTRAVWRAPLAPEMERRERAGVGIA